MFADLPKAMVAKCTDDDVDSTSPNEVAAGNDTDSNASTKSSSSSMSSSEPGAVEGAQVAAADFLISKGKSGRVHLCGSFSAGEAMTRCGRRLVRPQVCAGVDDAASASKLWSPRCFAAMSHDDRAHLLTMRPYLVRARSSAASELVVAL